MDCQYRIAQRRRPIMAKTIPCKSVTLVQKKSFALSGAKLAKAGPSLKLDSGVFVMLDNGDQTFTVLGQSDAGNPVDISDVATLAVTSDDTSIITIEDPIVGMTFRCNQVGTPPKLGAVNADVVATWKDASKGPFGARQPLDVQAGPAGGILIKPGVTIPH
jgi:hypothetical protein